MKKYGENSSIHKKKITPNIKDMKQLKQGTPVWWDGSIFMVNNISNIMLTITLESDDGRLVPVDFDGFEMPASIKPLTISEYIEHVMEPQGWEYQSKRVFSLTLKNQYTLWVCSINTMGDSVDYYPSITGNGKEIKYTSVDLRKLEQALTHCQRLNILKELEI